MFTPDLDAILLLGRQDTPACPAGTQHFKCGILGIGAFDGCCSVNPCRLVNSACPDSEDSTEPDGADGDGSSGAESRSTRMGTTTATATATNTDEVKGTPTQAQTETTPTQTTQTRRPTRTPTTAGPSSEKDVSPSTTITSKTPSTKPTTTLQSFIISTANPTTTKSDPSSTTTPPLVTPSSILPSPSSTTTTLPDADTTPLNAAIRPAASSSFSSTSAAPAASQSSLALPVSAIVGISVGCAVLLATVAFLVWYKHSRRVRRHELRAAATAEYTGGAGYGGGYGDRFAPDKDKAGAERAYTDLFRARPDYAQRPASEPNSTGGGSISGVPVVPNDVLQPHQGTGPWTPAGDYRGFRIGNF